MHKNQHHKTQRQVEKEKVYNHYGWECKCCGESNVEFLSLDHIRGGGKKQRRQDGKQHQYNWIIKNNFPNDFQVLCMNCNLLEAKQTTKTRFAHINTIVRNTVNLNLIFE